jgi:hypothetical protein
MSWVLRQLTRGAVGERAQVVLRPDSAVDILQEGINRSRPTRGIGPGPSLGAEARTRLSFRLIAKVAHRLVGHRHAGPFRKQV